MDYSAMFNAGSVAMVQPHSESMEVEGHYACSPMFTTDSDLCSGVVWMHAQPSRAVGFATPPPEYDEAATGLGYAQYPLSFGARTSAGLYTQGSSLADTPLSSPSSEFATLSISREDVEGRVMGMSRARSPLAQFRLRSAQGAFSGSDEDEPGTTTMNAIPVGVKMPQRKGGMQLWQFLYSLLTDPENKYRDIIEWTENEILKEFRILEPEAIAIWWGHHKNKPNMNYDKLSRSLRYYYERGLIQKMPRERFVYRFCIDPEVMYKHIGNSDARPTLKPMPKAAKEAFTNCREEDSGTSSRGCTSALVAQPPVSVSPTVSTSSASTDSHDSVSIPKRPPPPYPYENSAFQLRVSPPVSSGDYFMGDTSMRRCNSLEIGYTQTASTSSEHYPLHMSSSYPNLHSIVTQMYYSQSPEMSLSGFPETTSLPQPAGFELDSYSQNYSSPTYCVADSTSAFNMTPATAMWTFSQ